MAGSSLYQQQLPILYPHTYNAMTKMVMAMAKTSKNMGKKTFFGKDKGQESYDAFLKSLAVTVQCLILDEEANESTSTEEIYDLIGKMLEKFSLAHPNWQDAYSFAQWFFGDKANAIAAMDRLR